MRDCGIQLIELNYQCPHPSDYIGPKEGNWIAQDPRVTAENLESSVQLFQERFSK